MKKLLSTLAAICGSLIHISGQHIALKPMRRRIPKKSTFFLTNPRGPSLTKINYFPFGTVAARFPRRKQMGPVHLVYANRPARINTYDASVIKRTKNLAGVFGGHLGEPIRNTGRVRRGLSVARGTRSDEIGLLYI